MTMEERLERIHHRIDILTEYVVEELALKTKTNNALCDAVSDLRKNMAYLEVALCIVTGVAVVSLLLALEVLK